MCRANDLLIALSVPGARFYINVRPIYHPQTLFLHTSVDHRLENVTNGSLPSSVGGSGDHSSSIIEMSRVLLNHCNMVELQVQNIVLHRRRSMLDSSSPLTTFVSEPRQHQSMNQYCVLLFIS